jgi:large subunit ribosomal protein L15
MISQHSLKPNPGSRKRSRSFGRGDSSGHGSFSGHGGKGQTARSGGNIKSGFEGGQTPLIRRLPKLKGFKNPNRLPFQAVNVERLNDFEDGATVDIIALYENHLISRKNRPVKILGLGELTKKLTVKADACSESAKKKIEEKGGTILLPAKTPAKK